MRVLRSFINGQDRTQYGDHDLKNHESAVKLGG